MWWFRLDLIFVHHQDYTKQTRGDDTGASSLSSSIHASLLPKDIEGAGRALEVSLNIPNFSPMISEMAKATNYQ